MTSSSLFSITGQVYNQLWVHLGLNFKTTKSSFFKERKILCVLQVLEQHGGGALFTSQSKVGQSESKRSIQLLISSSRHQVSHVTARGGGASHVCRLFQLECHHRLQWGLQSDLHPQVSLRKPTFQKQGSWKCQAILWGSSIKRAVPVSLSPRRHDSAPPSTVRGEHFMLAEKHLAQNNGRQGREMIGVRLLITQNQISPFLVQAGNKNSSQWENRNVFAQNTSHHPVTCSYDYQPLRHLICLGHNAGWDAGYGMSFNQYALSENLAHMTVSSRR